MSADAVTYLVPPEPSVDLDLDARRLVLSGQEVALTFLEFELLAYVVRNRGRAITRTELLNRVWNYPEVVGDRTVDVHVRRLRQKLPEVFGLTTIRGYGYRFDGWRRAEGPSFKRQPRG